MSFTVFIIIISAISIVLTCFVKDSGKRNISLAAVIINAGVSSWPAIYSIAGIPFQEIIPGGPVFGDIPIRIDALSGWFIIVLNFTVFTGILYGRSYMRQYENKSGIVTIHYISYIIIHVTMIGILIVQNIPAFLFIWEIMTLSAFILIIFEYNKPETIKAGINFLIQSHICILFLIIGFIWICAHTNSYDFNAIGQYCKSVNPAISLVVYLCFFIGFAIKTGFVPFHTWLPYAHPVAPAHISGIMSGVMIKLGIFGIIRMLILVNQNYLIIGYFILILSLISGLYGIILAIVQQNLKKLLAYSSIENVGIIGMGIGLGSIGIALKDPYLAFTGFAAALLHTFNHSLYKSLLFQIAGSVYQTIHTLNIESMGGLVKKMPQTAILFLVAGISICGLPPFNGFVSEFLIYLGLFKGIYSGSLALTTCLILSVTGLVLIGGLAILCFTKAFGIIFLGKERIQFGHLIKETSTAKLFPGYLISLFIVIIGIFPGVFIGILINPVNLISNGLTSHFPELKIIGTLNSISLLACSFILVKVIILLIKRFIVRKYQDIITPTWVCGYVAPNRRMQYTAGSYVRSFRKLVQPILMMNKKEDNITGMLSSPIHSQTLPYDKIESVFIDLPLKYFNKILGNVRFIQNGNVRHYILYGVIFIFLIVIYTIFGDAVSYILTMLKHL
jgi:formate hydrogenlyase subunit 3/multisubunit Na+/H+ antiporter MnhD subunit